MLKRFNNFAIPIQFLRFKISFDKSKKIITLVRLFTDGGCSSGVEQRVVVPLVVGSKPIIRPICLTFTYTIFKNEWVICFFRGLWYVFIYDSP